MNLCFVGGAAANVPIMSNTRYLFVDYASQQALIERGVQPTRCWDALTIEEGRRLDRFCYERSVDWFRPAGRDITQWDSASLGVIHEWTVWFQTFIAVYRFAACAAQWLAHDTPDEIVWDDRLDARWLIALEQARVHYAPRATIHHIASDAGAQTSSKTWRPYSIQWKHIAAFTTSNLVSQALSLFKTRDRSKILASFYPTLRAVLEGVTFDPRFQLAMFDRPPADLWKVGVRHGLRFVLPKSITLSQADRAALECIQHDWRTFADSAEYQARFIWNEVDVWPALRGDLDAAIDRLPDTAMLLRGYQRTLAQEQPSCVFMPYDYPPLSRAIIEAARSLNIPTVVMPHGLPFFGNARDYFQADYLLIWGQALTDEFARLGRDRSTMIVTGFPKIDQYRPTNHLGAAIMILSSTFGTGSTLAAEDDPEVHLFGVLDALRDWPDRPVIIRPHPAESTEYYERLLAKSGRVKVRIAGGGPIEPLYPETGLIIGPSSTVFVEAMALRIPVICVNFSKLAYPAPYDGRSGLEVITAVNTLRDRVGQFVRGNLRPDPIETLEAICGPHDHHATARVLDALEQISIKAKQ